MNAKFIEVERAISGRDPSVCYRRESMCGDKTQRRQQTTKSKILTNALTYIQELQADNIRLQRELSALKE